MNEVHEVQQTEKIDSVAADSVEWRGCVGMVGTQLGVYLGICEGEGFMAVVSAFKGL